MLSLILPGGGVQPSAPSLSLRVPSSRLLFIYTSKGPPTDSLFPGSAAMSVFKSPKNIAELAFTEEEIHLAKFMNLP